MIREECIGKCYDYIYDLEIRIALLYILDVLISLCSTTSNTGSSDSNNVYNSMSHIHQTQQRQGRQTQLLKTRPNILRTLTSSASASSPLTSDPSTHPLSSTPSQSQSLHPIPNSTSERETEQIITATHADTTTASDVMHSQKGTEFDSHAGLIKNTIIPLSTLNSAPTHSLLQHILTPYIPSIYSKLGLYSIYLHYYHRIYPIYTTNKEKHRQMVERTEARIHAEVSKKSKFQEIKHIRRKIRGKSVSKDV